MSKRKNRKNKTKKENNGMLKGSSKIGFNYRKCHDGPIEVYHNLYLGSYRESMQMPKMGVDVLVPLYDLDSSIWETGFRGEILYFPIADYGILPRDVLDVVVCKIMARLADNKKVGIFCMAGHGRTGYIAACVLGKLGIDDPVQYIRDKYCTEAIESNKQVEAIAAYLDKPALIKRYPCYAHAYGYGGGWYDYGYADKVTTPLDYSKNSTYLQSPLERDYCCDCLFYRMGFCRMFDINVNTYQKACEDFAGMADYDIWSGLLKEMDEKEKLENNGDDNVTFADFTK